MKGLVLILIAFILLSILYYMNREAFRNQVVEKELYYEDFPPSYGELRIFFITDVHRRMIDEEVISQVKGRADFVLIGGDLTEQGVPYSRTFENLRRLSQIGKIIFIWGNNDYEVNQNELRKMIAEHGGIILDNDLLDIHAPTGEKIQIVGINEIAFGLDRLDLALEKTNPDAFKIVLCHNPKIFRQIKEEDRVQLVLSGHTHGGQINFFGLGLYPVGKHYRTRKGDLLISNGYGTTKLPLRLGAKAETHLLTIKHGKTDNQTF